MIKNSIFSYRETSLVYGKLQIVLLFKSITWVFKKISLQELRKMNDAEKTVKELELRLNGVRDKRSKLAKALAKVCLILRTVKKPS